LIQSSIFNKSLFSQGVVEKVSDEESDAYFNSRPRSSQIGAWTSNQSSTISGREELEAQEEAVASRFKEVEKIPRPQHWGGYRLIPSRVEFWKGRQSRLHDRIVFEKTSNNTWKIERLQP